MAQEPRDPAWAPDMETKLQDLVMAEPNKFSIRDIECRMSLCAVEVASVYGPYLGKINSNNPLDNNLFTWFGMFGYETDPSAARITVTLLTFKRR
jgi:hypothetical protein